jgi:hypothetical protein
VGSARLKAADEDARWTAAETVALRVSTIDVSTWKPAIDGGAFGENVAGHYSWLSSAVFKKS